jgi:ribosomal protein S18 acetylase RimI-like enzyme
VARPAVAARFRTKDGREVLLRPLALGDVNALVPFVNRLAKEKKMNRDLGIGSFDGRVTRKFEKGFLDSIVAAEKERLAVTMAAFAGRELVGECTLRRRERRDTRHTGVLGIVILDEYRGVGVGEKLMAEVLQRARRIGVWLVELEAMEINRGAIHLYEKLGFRRVGVVPGKILRDGRELDIVVMFADLRRTDKSSPAGRGKS